MREFVRVCACGASACASPPHPPTHARTLPRTHTHSCTHPPEHLSSEDLDEMNIEVLRNTLYKAYLDDFAAFVTAELGGTTGAVMGDLLAFEVGGWGAGACGMLSSAPLPARVALPPPPSFPGLARPTHRPTRRAPPPIHHHPMHSRPAPHPPRRARRPTVARSTSHSTRSAPS